MILYSPIKRGTKRGYSKNVDLNSLADFFKCQSQGFGVNPDYYAFLNIKGHNGLDISYEDGTEVFASHDGIAYPSEDSMKGLGVVVQDHEKKSIYWHLKSFAVDNGQHVKAGELLGLGDSTGFSTGSHLHFGVKLLDSNGNVLNRDNGFDGAIDPTPFLVWNAHEAMTETEVKNLYRLAFYRLPDAEELAYWTGKLLSDFLTTAIADRATFLSQ